MLLNAKVRKFPKYFLAGEEECQEDRSRLGKWSDRKLRRMGRVTQTQTKGIVAKKVKQECNEEMGRGDDGIRAQVTSEPETALSVYMS